MKSQPVRIPVIVHTNTFFNNFSATYNESWDSAYDSKSDSDSSNSSLDVLSTSPVHTKSGPARTIECKWVDCGKSFNYLDDLASHVTSFHANSGPGGLFFCGWEGCGRGDRGFNARYKMLVHVRTHTNEKPHHCFQCDKSFSRAENLKIHARSHTGERPYVCPVPGCGKAYSNSSDRFKHTRTHSVDKPYICKVPGCGKRYTDPSSLRKHVKTYRHFPTAQPAEDNQNKNIPNVFKMDEEMETEQIVPQTETNLTNLTPVSREEISQTYRYYRYNIEDNSDVRYEIFRNWFNREQMPWSHSDAQTLESKCRNYYNNHLQEQDMPLDLTVHK